MACKKLKKTVGCLLAAVMMTSAMTSTVFAAPPKPRYEMTSAEFATLELTLNNTNQPTMAWNVYSDGYRFLIDRVWNPAGYIERNVHYQNGWKWLDDDGDGVAECYCFNAAGTLLTDMVTSDGCTVNKFGQWTVNGVVQTRDAASVAGEGIQPVGAWKAVTDSTGRIINGNQVRQALRPGETWQVSNGTWIRDEKGFKFKKLDGFYVDPDTGKVMPWLYDPYVVDCMWMTDDNGDGTWEIYAFDKNGYLYTNVDESGSGSGFDPYGLHDATGYLITNNYRGTWGATGPYEVIQRGGKWRCENGTLPDFSTDMYWQITGDYASDATRVAGGIDHELNRVHSHNNIVYKYMN